MLPDIVFMMRRQVRTGAEPVAAAAAVTAGQHQEAVLDGALPVARRVLRHLHRHHQPAGDLEPLRAVQRNAGEQEMCCGWCPAPEQFCMMNADGLVLLLQAILLDIVLM
jgi:hypothetical protein